MTVFKNIITVPTLNWTQRLILNFYYLEIMERFTLREFFSIHKWIFHFDLSFASNIVLSYVQLVAIEVQEVWMNQGIMNMKSYQPKSFNYFYFFLCILKLLCIFHLISRICYFWCAMCIHASFQCLELPNLFECR